VKPNAIGDDGAFENATVAVPLNCLLKLFAVERSIVTLPPTPKLLYASLNVVELMFVVADIAPVTLTSPVCIVFPVIVNVDPLNVILLSTFAPNGDAL